MKTTTQLVYAATLLVAIIVLASCKKTGDPGPAGENGTNGTIFPYYESGTSLNISGQFNSNNAAFDKLLQLPYYSNLQESHVTIADGNHYQRISADGKNHTFDIIRYDKLNNACLVFRISNDENDNISIERFSFDVKTDITNTQYKKLYTTYPYQLPMRTSGPHDDKSELNHDELTTNGNSFSISNWNFNTNTHLLTFDYEGLLTADYNSTGNDLNISGSVKATVRNGSFRQGK